MTFALVVFVAPALAVGTGTAIARLQPSRRPTEVPEPPVLTLVPDVPAPGPRARISVEPRPGGRWAVKKDGMQRASRVFDSKQDAVDRARAQATQEDAELVIAS